MLVSESRTSRRVIGRLDRGAPLTDTILTLCRDHAVRSGEIRAIGSLESVEVAEYDQAAQSWKPSRSFDGGLQVLSLTGNVSERNGQLALNLSVTLMRDRDSGVEVIGGHLVRGRVFALELTIDAFDDLILRRGLDPVTGLEQWTEAVTPGIPEAAPPPPVPPPTWAEVARAGSARSAPSSPSPSGARERERTPEAEPDDAETEDSLEAGDVLIHPTFGRCDVQRIEGGYEFAQVRLKNGRLVRLSLDMLMLVRAGTEGGHRVFRARLDD